MLKMITAMETVTDTVFRIIHRMQIFHKILTGIPIPGLTQKIQEPLGHFVFVVVSSHIPKKPRQEAQQDMVPGVRLGRTMSLPPRGLSPTGAKKQSRPYSHGEVIKLVLLSATKKILQCLHPGCV